MKYKELRERIKAFCFGEGIYKEDLHELKALVDMALDDIATRVVPMCLISSDMRRYEILRYIDKERFIRVPYKIIDDNTIIDIDNALLTALVYRVTSQLANNSLKPYYDKLYKKELDHYTYAHFYSLEDEY